MNATRPRTILHTEHSDGWGGQEMRIVSEATGVAEHGHRVLLAAPPGARILAPAAAAGLHVVALPMPGNLNLPALAALVRLIRRERVDLINTHSSIDAWLGGAAARLTGTRLLRTRHISKRIRAHIFNVVHRWPDVTITTGAALRDDFLTDTGLAADRVVSIPTGVDLRHFRPSADRSSLRRTLGVGDDARIVAAVGVLRRAKRHELFVEVAATLRDHPQLYFVIAGEGGQRAAIEARIAALDLGERVRLLGHVDDVRWVMSGADLVVSTSHGMEGVPQALAQAMAMQRPVVATADGAVGELVLHEHTGLLVPPERVDLLAAAVARGLHETSAAAEWAARGREHVVASYSRDAMVSALLRLYDSLPA